MSTKSPESYWADVRLALTWADSIAFDGCHKVYVLMDEAQTTEMRGYGYGSDDPSYLQPVTDPDEALATIQAWFYGSCGLEFVNAVRTVSGNPNDGFTQLIPQFAFDDEEGEGL